MRTKKDTKKEMDKPTTRQLDGTMIAASVSVAMLFLCTVGNANANGGSQSFYLNTFASLQKTHARIYPVRTGHRGETSSLRQKYRLVRCH
jgi:hypothetical protein